MRAEAPDGLPNATAIAAVIERLRALSEEEAQALGDAHSRWWHPTADGTAFAAARRWHAREAVRETLERRGWTCDASSRRHGRRSPARSGGRTPR